LSLADEAENPTLQAALRYAEAGIPVLPVRVSEEENGRYKKKPLIRDWPNQASTDPRKINPWWHRWPDASIGIVCGERSGLLVVDEDRPGALEELPGELPETAKARTISGGRHAYLRWRPGLTNSPGGLPRDVDVRGEGGFAVAPPSPGYSWTSTAPPAEIPGPILDILQGGDSPSPGEQRSTQRHGTPSGPVPEGERNRTMFFEALDAKDSGGSAGEVLETIRESNTARYQPPLEQSEVERIAKSAMRYPVRSGRATPEIAEAVRELVAAWWDHPWRGLGGQSDRDVLRVLLELALRYGRLNEDGSVDISASVRSLSLASAVNYVTVSRGCTHRLEDAEWAEKIPAENPTHSATWRLRVPASLDANTQQEEGTAAGVLAPRDALPEETPTWRHRGLVKKGPGFVEALLETSVSMSRDEVAEALGWSNAREVERRYLRLLEDRGLAEKREDGRWALAEDHADAVERIKQQPYTVLLRGETWEWNALSEGWEWQEAIYSANRSEDERAKRDAAEHERQREEFRAELVRREVEDDQEDEVAFDELPEAGYSMQGASKVGRYLIARGWKRMGRREWASPETGEVVPPDRAMEEAKPAS
jgi:DNA-binding transcriptional ArsR family regulator